MTTGNKIRDEEWIQIGEKGIHVGISVIILTIKTIIVYYGVVVIYSIKIHGDNETLGRRGIQKLKYFQGSCF